MSKYIAWAFQIGFAIMGAYLFIGITGTALDLAIGGFLGWFAGVVVWLVNIAVLGLLREFPEQPSN